MTAAWLFGKLPTHGDFIARGLSASSQQRLDSWLAAELERAAITFGDGFKPAFEAAPPWNFAWDEEAGWTAGAMAPSVDRAGRHFVIMMGVGRLAAEVVESAASACEEAIYEAFGGAAIEDLLVRVAAARSGDGDRVTAECWWSHPAEGERIMVSGRHPSGLIEKMLELGTASA